MDTQDSIAPRPTLPKRERLFSRKQVESLFGGSESRSVGAFPLRAVYRLVDCPSVEVPAQLLISVPKKRFRHAVDRNRVKRQVREAYRRHKGLLHAAVPAGRQVQVAFIWLSDRHSESAEVTERVVSLLRRIGERVGKRRPAATGSADVTHTD